MKIKDKISDSYLKEIKKFDKETTMWILKNMRPQIVNIVLLSVLYAMFALCGVFMADFAKNIVNSAAYDKSWGQIVYYGVLLIVLVVSQLIIKVLANITVFKVNAKLEISMKTNLFRTMLKKSYSSVSSYHTGELLNRLTGDVTVITNSITTTIPSLVFFIVKLIGVFCVLFAIDWKFTIVFFVGGILLILVMNLFKGSLKHFHKKAQETDGKVRSFMQESLAALLMIKVFNGQNKIIDESDKLQQDNYDVKRKRNMISIGSSTGMSLVFSLAYVYGLIWGAVSIYNGTLNYGELTQVLSLVSQIQSPLQGLTSILPSYYQALASAERIIEIEKLPDEHTVNSNAQINPDELYSNLQSIEFSDITFGYDSELILENTDLKINKGDFMLISGISGIGKSTLIKLLLDVFPVNNGEIFLKLKNGEKIPVDKNLRCMFAYVPQGNFLLSGTIRDNISFVRPDATDEEIDLAVKTACADFVYNLPQGLDTIIGEKGQGLSEGQIQRIAIARAIICHKPVILLDEATSALDSETELKLLKNIENLKNKTCILISHKKAAVNVCNKEVRIENKKIILKDI